MRHLLLSTVLFCTASLAQAEDAALVIGIADYVDFRDVRDAGDVATAGGALNDYNFTVYGNRNSPSDSAAIHRQAEGFADLVPDSKRMIVVLAGQFVTDGGRTWLLADNAGEPGPFTVEQRSISVDTALNLLARAPGAAILVLGYDQSERDAVALNLREGVGNLNIPSGVTVVRGEVDAVADLLRNTIATPGGDIIAGVRRDRDLTATGFVPDRLVLVPSDAAPAPSRPAGGSDEAALWVSTRLTDTQAGYTAYLDRFPDGPHAADAVARLRALRDPGLALKQAEDSINLSVAARRAIQRDLQVLGYDTRGIDGIFGPGTRGAIKSWQAQNNVAQTSYLTAEQIARIDAMAARRAAELEAEAKARREAEERADRAFWAETGAKGGGPAWRAYLERYPDGLFAKEANAQMDALRAANRNAAEASDRAAWDQARAADTLQAYRNYLNRNGRRDFSAEAEARIKALAQANSNQAANEQAAATERALALDPISLRLVEARLAQLGLEPGNVDGRIDGDTRGAIRKYQRDRQLTVSGFLDQATVSQMLTDAFR